MHAPPARMPTTEHILLESDVREVPDLRGARKVHAQLEFRTRLRRRVLQLDIIDYYYLSVRSRAGSLALDYVLDLRFVATRLSRHIAWRWITASLLSIALASGIATWIGSAAVPWWRHPWLPWCAAIMAASVLVTLVAAYRTTETVSLVSTYGAARLLEFTGGVGTFRAVRPFMTRLAAHIRLASKARRPTRAEHLRDEMREHLRLKEAGVLSTEEYDASKVRILNQHSRSPHARAQPV